MPSYFPDLGPALRLLRSRRQLKQTDVATKSGLTKAMLSSYETGKSTPSLASLIAILGAVGTDLSELQDALEAVSGSSGSARSPLGYEGLREAAWKELREVLRELQGPLERVAVAIERLSGPEEPGLGADSEGSAV